MRCTVRCKRAKGPCWSWTPRKGIQAQTMAHLFAALEQNLTIVPVINKIDLPAAMPDDVAEEIEELLGTPAEDIPRISAKAGINVEVVLQQVVEQVPPPKGNRHQPLRALVFDCRYDSYKGVIAYVRVVDGAIEGTPRLLAMNTGKTLDPLEIGVLVPVMLPINELTRAR